MSSNDPHASDEEILIDLNKPMAARVMDSKSREFIQIDALKRVRALIARQLREIDSKPEQHPDVLDRRHNAITIIGGRGVGKTTFVVSLRHNLTLDAEFSRDIAFCGRPIDPTLIETKEHIFVTILSEMVRLVDDHYHLNENRRSGGRSNIEENYKSWRRHLRKLSEGLTLLDGVGCESRQRDWENPADNLERGIHRASSGLDLEKYFHDFIVISLNFLGKRAFFLVLDDIDTRFDQGAIVLEVLRKYFTSPHLIIVISGDINLYSLLASREQWKMLNSSVDLGLLGREFVVSAVEELKTQYVNKILKIQNRVQLKSLDAIVNGTADGRGPIRVVLRDMLRPETRREPVASYPELSAIVAALCRHFLFIRDPQEIARVVSLLLAQPTRSVFHLLSVLPADFMSEEYEARDAAVVEFHNMLTELSVSGLHAHNIRTEDLQEARISSIFNLLIVFFNGGKLWRDGYRLLPAYPEDDKNLSLLALGSKLTFLLTQEPVRALAGYFVSIGITREAAKMGDTQFYQDFVGLAAHSGAVVARRSAGYFRSTNDGRQDNHGPRMGSIALQSYPLAIKGVESERTLEDLLASNEKDDRRHYHPYRVINFAYGLGNEAGNFNTMWTLEARTSGLGHMLVGLPALRLSDVAGVSHSYLSIFPLIAIMGELLEGNKSEFDIYQNLLRLGDVSSFPLYCDQDKFGVDSQASLYRAHKKTSIDVVARELDGLEPEYIELDPYRSHVTLGDFVSAWVAQAKKTRLTSASTSLLAKIWQRFFQTVEYVEEVGVGKWYAGNLLHRYVVAFLNAVLIEEFMETIVPAAEATHLLPNFLSPARTDFPFFDNLVKIYFKRKESLPLFNIVFSCPFWGGYLRPKLYLSDADLADSQRQAYQERINDKTRLPDKLENHFYQDHSTSRKWDEDVVTWVLGNRSANGEVWRLQVQAWHPLTVSGMGDDPDVAELLQRQQTLTINCRYSARDNGNVCEDVVFPNAYFLYNSIPVQGVLQSAIEAAQLQNENPEENRASALRDRNYEIAQENA